MTIVTVDGPQKQCTFEFTAEEWAILLWVRENRGLGWFVQWLETQLMAMAARRDSETQEVVRRAWAGADQATKDQVRTLLGI